MKDKTQTPYVPMDEKRKEAVKKIVLEEWDNYDTKEELANAIMEGYIFGKYAASEHYLIDEYRAIVEEVAAEKIVE